MPEVESPRANFLGVGVDPIRMQDCLQAIALWIEGRRRTYVCLTAVHSILECRRDSDLRRIFNNSGLTTADGMAVVWLCRLLGHRQAERVYGPDLMLAASALCAERGYRVYFYGGDPGIARRLADRLIRRFPGLVVAGLYSPPRGPMDAAENKRVIDSINASRADLVWVGLGTGKQEHWMAAQRAQLEAPVLIAVGAAFDFLAGAKPQAPPWMRGAGLEWLFRLATEPRRLWPRYREYPRFAWLLLGQVLGLREYPLDR